MKDRLSTLGWTSMSESSLSSRASWCCQPRGSAWWSEDFEKVLVLISAGLTYPFAIVYRHPDDYLFHVSCFAPLVMMLCSKNEYVTPHRMFYAHKATMNYPTAHVHKTRAVL
jgi:hypothetical protein